MKPQISGLAFGGFPGGSVDSQLVVGYGADEVVLLDQKGGGSTPLTTRRHRGVFNEVAILEGGEGGFGVAVGEHGIPELFGDGAMENGTGAEHLAGRFGEALDGLLDSLTDAATKQTAAGELMGGGGGGEFGFVIVPVTGDVALKGGLANFVGNYLQDQGMPIIKFTDTAEVVYRVRILGQSQFLE